MDLVVQGDLAEYLHTRTVNSKYPSPLERITRLFGCLASGMASLHAQNIRHRDTKPENILVMGGEVLFTDFGLSFNFQDMTLTGQTEVRGTKKYCTPELDRERERGRGSDIYSLGAAILEMLTVCSGAGQLQKLRSRQPYSELAEMTKLRSKDELLTYQFMHESVHDFLVRNRNRRLWLDLDSRFELLGKCLVNVDLAKSRQETSALLLQLTYLPLAIVQATAYLSLLAEQEEEVIDLLSKEFEDNGRYRDIKNPVATTWLISFDQIQRRDRLAADYLSFMACIEPKDIPQSLLPVEALRKKEVDAIGTLTAYSFINKRPADECLNLYRLVHLATRNWLQKEELLAQSTERAILRLREVFPDHKHRNRTVWRKYLTYTSYALESDAASNNNKARTSLLWKLGICLYQEGWWNEAERAFLQVMETRKRVLGPEHPDTLTSMANLALTYRNQGRWKEAEELDVQVMETRKRVLGEHHRLKF